MENLTQLLQQLAEKLGTTTEYLWGVLIKQAPISAVTDLVYLFLVILGGIALYKIHKRFSKEIDGNKSIYYEHEWLEISMVFVSFTLVVIFIYYILSIKGIITGFFNPEYWAFNEVVRLLK